MATSSLRMYAYSCGSDEYCWNLIVNLTSTESMTGDASAPYDLAKCYPDLGYICGAFLAFPKAFHCLLFILFPLSSLIIMDNVFYRLLIN